MITQQRQNITRILFQKEQIVATPGAIAVTSHEHRMHFRFRHIGGEWGNVPPEDKASNNNALKHGGGGSQPIPSTLPSPARALSTILSGPLLRSTAASRPSFCQANTNQPTNQRRHFYDDIQSIALDLPDHSKANIRVTGQKDGIEELDASIAAHGLRLNLNVTPAGDSRFEVVAGGRRLRAIKLLVNQEKRLISLLH